MCQSNYHDQEQQCTIIKCSRDKRRNAIDPITGCKGTYPFMGVLSIRDILKVVKAEFSTFGDTLGKVQKSLTTASTSLENLRTTRINVMERKLRDVESLTVSKIDLLEQEN